MDNAKMEYEEAVAATREFYYRFARYYDEFVPPKELRTDRVDSLVQFVRGKTANSGTSMSFMELGCGTGSYAIPLARCGHRVVGVDVSGEMRKLALRKVGGESLSNFEYLETEWIEAMQAWRGEFDCILCIGNSIIHNPSGILPSMFKAALRALKPGGLMILNGRRIERELDMQEGVDFTQQEICRSAGPAKDVGSGLRNALRFMFMSKCVRTDDNKTVVTFYTYDNYEEDGRRFVCHRMLFDNSKNIEMKPMEYDCFSTKTYFLFEEELFRLLRDAGFIDIKEESPDERYFSLEKNWYVMAQKPSQ